jgi:hypothetical protein
LWTQSIQQESQSAVEVFNALASAPVLNAFLDFISQPGRWVGIQTLLLYARTVKTFSLHIHRMENDFVLPAADKEKHLQLSGNEVIHIVYNGSNHFDRLVELPQQANDPSQANVFNNPGNPAASRRRAAPSTNANIVAETPQKRQKKTI